MSEMTMKELQIVYLKPEELTPYEKNARKHGPKDIDGIKKSILDVGFDDPIGIWGKKNIVVEGHGRLIAAKELHLEKVPCIRLDHLTDEQRREYTIRHNRSAELSAWDFEILEEELAKLSIDGIDMKDLEFTFPGADDLYVDDFFDRGVEAKEKEKVIGVKVVCDDDAEKLELMKLLRDNGYRPEEL